MIEISAAAVSTATCKAGLRYAKSMSDVTLTSSVNSAAAPAVNTIEARTLNPLA